MNKDTELIELYLSGGMNATEKDTFEARLRTEERLLSQFNLQAKLMKGFEQASMRKEIKAGRSSAKIKRSLKTIRTTVIATALATALFFGIQKYIKSTSSDEVLYETNELGTKNWTQADHVLPSQVFELSAQQDTVIESKEGILLAIPAGAFADAAGKPVTGTVEIELKEAMTPLEIMKSGLSTTSNGELLATGGMFYVNARQDGNSLKMASGKAITADVPNLNPKEDMLLFDGQRSVVTDNEGSVTKRKAQTAVTGTEVERGSTSHHTETRVSPESTINWVNPRPFESKLKTTDILKLNFYPPGFLDTLSAMGFDSKNNRLTDSIYYSIACRSNYTDEFMSEADSIVRKDTVSAHLHAYSESIGEQLFKQNCAVCHSTGTAKITGPGLASVKERAPGGDFLKRFILNNQKVIKSGDPYAKKIYEENGKAQMTVFEGQLSDKDVEAILEFLDHSKTNQTCEIDPMRIRAIWNQQYNHTILATKEFETRLQFIFKACSEDLLNIYTGSLNRKLYQCDSMALHFLEMNGQKALAAKFYEFYLEKKGGIVVEEKHLQKLVQLKEERTKAYMLARDSALKKLYSKEAITNQEAFEKKYRQDSVEAFRFSKTLYEEIEKNLEEAYRQLGKEKPKIVFPPNGYLSADIITLGWKNVDVYVKAATIARTSMHYVDPESYKKAEINYTPLQVNVSNFKDYDRVNAYLLPKSLSSFNRMNELKPGQFDLSLNEFIEYDLVVLGFKGEAVAMAEAKSVKPGTLNLKLKKSNEVDLKRFEKFKTDLWQDIQFTQFDLKENKRTSAILKREEITARLRSVVFPCEVHLPSGQRPEMN